MTVRFAAKLADAARPATFRLSIFGKMKDMRWRMDETRPTYGSKEILNDQSAFIRLDHTLWVAAF